MGLLSFFRRIWCVAEDIDCMCSTTIWRIGIGRVIDLTKDFLSDRDEVVLSMCFLYNVREMKVID